MRETQLIIVGGTSKHPTHKTSMLTQNYAQTKLAILYMFLKLAGFPTKE